MEQIHLTSKEILYIASIGGAEEFIGIPDGFYGMSEAEIAVSIQEVRNSLCDKGCAEMDFDGNFTIKQEIIDAVNECANFKRYISFEKVTQGKNITNRYYFGQKYVYFINNIADDFEISIVSKSKIKESLLNFIDWKNEKELPNTKVIIEKSVLYRVKNMSEFDNPENELKMKGCDDLEAKIIYNGLNGTAEYYSLMSIDYTNKDDQFGALLFINSENGAVELIASENGDESVEFTPITLTEIVNKINEIIGNID